MGNDRALRPLFSPLPATCSGWLCCASQRVERAPGRAIESLLVLRSALPASAALWLRRLSRSKCQRHSHLYFCISRRALSPIGRLALLLQGPQWLSPPGSPPVQMTCSVRATHCGDIERLSFFSSSSFPRP